MNPRHFANQDEAYHTIPIGLTKNDEIFFPLKNSKLEDENKKLGKMMEGHLEDCAPNSSYRIHLYLYFIVNHVK